MDNGATNGNPSAIVFAEPTYNPGGGGLSNVNAPPVGVYYDNGSNEWCIFNEALSNMTLGETFNVLVVPSATASAYTYTATAPKIFGDGAILNNALLNSNPNAKIIVTPVWNPSTNVYDANSPSVAYDPTSGRWQIFNTSTFSNMSVGMKFNVLIGASSSGGGTAKIWTSSASTVSGDATFLSYPLVGNDPNAVVFATQNYDPHGVGGLHGGIGDSVVTGVYYDTGRNTWAVWNEDFSNMVTGASFNVLMFAN